MFSDASISSPFIYAFYHNFYFFRTIIFSLQRIFVYHFTNYLVPRYITFSYCLLQKLGNILIEEKNLFELKIFLLQTKIFSFLENR